jgi:hypothetical protein
MPLTDLEDRHLMTAFGGPAGDNALRQAIKKFAQQPPDDTMGAIPGGLGATLVVEEFGDANDHITKLTCAAFAVGTIPDNVALGFGAKFYTFPPGSIYIPEATIAGGLTGAVSVTAQTPEVGIGTVVASGAIATLTTGTFENLIDGGAAGGTIDAALVAPDVAGTFFAKTNLSTARGIIKTSGGAARDLFLNVAATWADVTTAGALTFTGVIQIKWRKIN